MNIPGPWKLAMNIGLGVDAETGFNTELEATTFLAEAEPHFGRNLRGATLTSPEGAVSHIDVKKLTKKGDD